MIYCCFDGLARSLTTRENRKIDWGGIGALTEPFPNCLTPLFQSKAYCKAIVMKMIFHSHANKTNFHWTGFALILVMSCVFMQLIFS